MPKENELVTVSELDVNVTQTQNLEELSKALEIKGCTKIGIFFKKNKVTAGCCYDGRSFGARSKTIFETLSILKNKIEAYNRVKLMFG